MAHASFVHLRVHTAYSLSEGAIHVKDLIKQCQGLKMPAVAVTDSNNMFAALEFCVSAAGAGVQPIVGVTLDVHEILDDGARLDSKLVLLAQTRKGYENLMVLVSKAHLESDAAIGPSLPLNTLTGLSEGVIALTGGVEGPIGQHLQQGAFSSAEAVLTQLIQCFDDRLYMEIQRHGLETEQACEDAFLDLAYSHNVPLVATNQPYFTGPAMFEAHDTLLCMADSTYVSDTKRRRLSADFRFKSDEDMLSLFSDLPEAVENTLQIAQRCDTMVRTIDPLLPNFTRGMDVSEADMLGQEAEKGLQERLDFIEKHGQEGTDTSDPEWSKPYWPRLKHELSIINKMGFPGYFLIVADFIQWAKDHDIPVGPGRGSGAGSVVAWALKITDLDPLRFSLLFERFLNPERVSMPDFDIDFCQDRREEVIRYVQEKYGHDHVAQIITFGKLQARAVVKACGRVLQQPYPVTDRLSKLIPNDPGNALSLSEAIEAEPRLRSEMESDELTRTVMERALKLEGLYAHSSTHAAGVVIGDRPLDQLVPLYRDPKSDMPVTQFNMKWVENAGLVKFDFLGLKTLTVLDRAVHYIKARGISIDLAAVPLDDKASYNLLASGEAAGVFQLESSGMRSVLKGLKPSTFEDIIAIVALYRPGPMDNIPLYIERKHGREKVEYPHPMLEDILSETFGIIVYQEQVMQIAQEMGGYSLGGADLLRRAMGKKIAAEMEKQRVVFCEGAVDNGVDRKKADEIYDLVAKFASYGFNKSHAAAYALVAYHTAYLKANFPVEFMAAIMTLDMGNTDKLAFFKQELNRLGIPLLLPDINTSHVAFTVEEAPEPYCEQEGDPRHNLAVRYALAAIKGVGDKAMAAIVAERTENGPFKTVNDFAKRIDPQLLNKRQLEQLAAAGAFDGLISEDRACAFAAAEVILKTAQRSSSERNSAQVSLFGGEEIAEDRIILPKVKSWTDTEKLEAEKKAVGFYISAHPLDSYDKVLQRERILEAIEAVRPEMAGQTLKMAGSIAGYREITSKRNGKKFGALTLSDRSDVFELLVFEDHLDHVRDLVEAGSPIVVTVDVRLRKDDEEQVGLSARGLESLEQVAASSSTGLMVELGGPKAFDGLQAALNMAKGGRGKVHVRIPLEDNSHIAEWRIPGLYKVTPQLIQAIGAEIDVRLAEEV